MDRQPAMRPLNEVWAEQSYIGILEQILLKSEARDILSCSAVSHHINDLITTSSRLQLHLRGILHAVPSNYIVDTALDEPTIATQLHRLLERERNLLDLHPKRIDDLQAGSEEAFLSDGMLLLTESNSQVPMDPDLPGYGEQIDGWSLWNLKDGIRALEDPVCELRYRVKYHQNVEEIAINGKDKLLVVAVNCEDEYPSYLFKHRSLYRFHLYHLDPYPKSNKWEPIYHPEAAMPSFELSLPKCEPLHPMEIRIGMNGKLLLRIARRPDYEHCYCGIWDWRQGICQGLVWPSEGSGCAYEFDFLTDDIIMGTVGHNLHPSLDNDDRQLEHSSAGDESEFPDVYPQYAALRFFKILPLAEGLPPIQLYPGHNKAPNGWRFDEIQPCTPISTFLLPPLDRGEAAAAGGEDVWDHAYAIDSLRVRVAPRVNYAYHAGVISFILSGSYPDERHQSQPRECSGAVAIWKLFSRIEQEGRVYEWNEWKDAVDMDTHSGMHFSSYGARTFQAWETGRMDITDQPVDSLGDIADPLLKEIIVTVRDHNPYLPLSRSLSDLDDLPLGSVSNLLQSQKPRSPRRIATLSATATITDPDADDDMPDDRYDTVPTRIESYAAGPVLTNRPDILPKTEHMFHDSKESWYDVERCLQAVECRAAVHIDLSKRIRELIFDGQRLLLCYNDSIDIVSF